MSKDTEEKILVFLKNHKNKFFNLGEIMSGTKIYNYDQVRLACKKLVEAGQITIQKLGIYVTYSAKAI